VKATACPYPHAGDKTVLEAAILHPALVEYLVKERHIDPNLKDLFDNTAISATLECNGPRNMRMTFAKVTPQTKQAQLQSLKTLLELGANPNAELYHPDLGKMPALVRAALAGCPEAVELLIAHKADANVADKMLPELPGRQGGELANIPLRDVREKGIEKSIELIRQAPRK